MRLPKFFRGIAFVVAAASFSLVLCFAILAWSEPGQTPPGGNAASPLNTGGNAQTKSGDLKIGGGLKISSIGQSFALKKDDDTIKFVVGQDGNVGIGTASPSNQLYIGGSGGILNLGAIGWVDPGSTGGSIVTDNNGYKALMIVGNNVSGNSGKGREVKVWDFLNVQGQLSTTGNVGIGTASPYVKTHISSSGSLLNRNGLMIGVVGDPGTIAVPLGSETQRMEIGFAGYRDMEPQQVGAKISAIRTNVWAANSAYVQGTDLAFSTGTGFGGGNWNWEDASTERIRIKNNGNVGIGTTAPNQTLDVNGVVKERASVFRMNKDESGTSDWAMGNLIPGGSVDNNLHISNFTSGVYNWTDRITVLNAGNVGIGTTSPGFKLDINGDANATRLCIAGDCRTGWQGGMVTQTKDNIVGRTDSGWFQTSAATTANGWPLTSNSWYHLFSSTHTNTANYYSFQIAADFFNNSDFFVRATSGNGLNTWKRIITDNGAGNVGIGTASPNAKLNVVGTTNLSRDITAECCSGGDYTLSLAENTSVTGKKSGIQFHNSGVSEGQLRLDSGTNGRELKAYSPQTDMDLHATGMIQGDQGLCIGTDCRTSWGSITGPWTASGNNISNNNSGNVGIGTTNPGVKLDVKGTLKVAGTVSGAGPNYGGYFSVGYGSATSPGPTNYAGYFDAYGGYATNYGIFVYRGMSYFGGNVGIGTASPTEKLEINGNLKFTGANPYISASSYFIAPGGAYFNGGTVYTEAAIQARGGIHNDSAAYLTLSGGTSGYTYFSGNVGIGTASPGAKLDVGGGGVLLNGTAGRNYFKDTELNSGTGLRVGAAWGMYGIYAENGYAVVGGASGVNLQNGVLVISGTNVGIGTTTPEEKLDVNGAIKVESLTSAPAVTTNKLYSVGGDLYWNGTKLNNSAASSPAGLIKQTVSKTTTNNISTSSSSWRDISDVTTSITTDASKLMILWNAGVNCQGSANMAELRVLVDGAQAGGVYNYSSGAYDYIHPYSSTDGSGARYDVISVDSMSGHAVIDAISAGTHTVKLQWKYVGAGLYSGACYIWPQNTGNGYTFTGTMTTMEISK